MKENKELERSDLAIDRDMDVGYDRGIQITVLIETWFNVDEKFGIKTADDDSRWLNLYGQYNPFEDTLRIIGEVCHDYSDSKHFAYEPTPAEAQLIKDMITEKIMAEHNQTPQEFCESVLHEDEEVYVYKNTQNLSSKQLQAQTARIKAYMEANSYVNGGSMSISLPMSMAGEHYQDMIEYCRSHGIFKIVVDSSHDIANDLNSLRRMLNRLCDNGLTVEAADSGIAYTPVQEQQAEETDEGITLGGM